jgi:uncharacterized protein DUF6702
VIRALVGLYLAAAHPMHTSVAELRYDGAAREAMVTIRVYPDDLAGAVPGAERAVADSALVGYVRARFALTDRRGRSLRLEWQGVERAADALVIRLRAALPEGLEGARVAHLLLHDRFGDQVNVVRASYGRRTATLLFVPGDGPKRLP